MGSVNLDSWTDCRGVPCIRTPALIDVGDHNVIHSNNQSSFPQHNPPAANSPAALPCPISAAFGDILRTLRHQQALSLAALAQRSRVDLVRLILMDEGQLTPTARELARIAIALQVPASALLCCLDLSDPPA